MSLVDAGSYALHLVFAGAWTGSVLFTTYAVLPVARAGDINADPLAIVVSRLRVLSRVSALVLLLTGGHLAGARYGMDLTSSVQGHLVIGMIVLWLLLAGLVEVGTKRIGAGLGQRKVRTPADEGWSFFVAASVVAVLLLVDAGLLLGL